MAQFQVGDLREKALPRYVIDDQGNVLGTIANPLHTDGSGGTASPPLPFTFGGLTAQTMGNAGPAEVIPANANRRALIVTNISDVYAYFSFGNGAGLTTTTYAWLLPPGYAVYIDEPLSTQAVSAICGNAAKVISYQEAV